MRDPEYLDINTLIDAVKMVRSSKIKEYDHIGRIAARSLKALERLKKCCPMGKESCPLKASMTK